MKKALFLLGVVAFLATFLTGCASVFSKSEYDVQILSDRPGDVVILKQGYKTIANRATPYTMRLRASQDFFRGESYTLEYVYPNGQRDEALYNAGMDPWVIGSVIFTGCLGLLVDGATGAMYKLPPQFYICTSDQYRYGNQYVQTATPSQAEKAETIELKAVTAPEEEELNPNPDYAAY